MSQRPKYQTLEIIGMKWVVTFEMLGMVVFAVSIALAFCFPLFGLSFKPKIIGLGFVAMISLALVHHRVFYHGIKCPQCSGKLNKFKNGKNVPIKKAHTQLDNGYGCRHCGWKPDLGGGIRHGA